MVKFESEKMGFKNPSVYWKYEQGRHKLKAEMIPLLADILQCDPKNFFAYQSAKTEQEQG